MPCQRAACVPCRGKKASGRSTCPFVSVTSLGASAPGDPAASASGAEAGAASAGDSGAAVGAGAAAPVFSGPKGSCMHSDRRLRRG